MLTYENTYITHMYMYLLKSHYTQQNNCKHNKHDYIRCWYQLGKSEKNVRFLVRDFFRYKRNLLFIFYYITCRTGKKSSVAGYAATDTTLCIAYNHVYLSYVMFLSRAYSLMSSNLFVKVGIIGRTFEKERNLVYLRWFSSYILLDWCFFLRLTRI